MGCVKREEFDGASKKFHSLCWVMLNTRISL
jgi:hypothetical protein